MPGAAGSTSPGSHAPDLSQWGRQLLGQLDGALCDAAGLGSIAATACPHREQRKLRPRRIQEHLDVVLREQEDHGHFQVRADITYFTTRNGGAVFSASSIAWCGALAHNGYDNNVSRMTANVLRRFLRDEPLPDVK